MARQSRAKAEETPKTPPVPMFLGEPLSELTEQELQDIAADPEEFDIFMDVGDALTRAGDRITYTIKRDGEFIAGSVKHPFSWDMVQQKYGGGTFQVIARSTNKKGYVKSESRNVAPLTTENQAPVEREERRDSASELLSILQAEKRLEREEAREAEERREQERRDREARAEEDRRRREDEMKNAGNSTMLMMMKMMEAQSSQTTALLTALITGGQKKEPEINVEKIMQLMDTRMEKVVAMLQGKDKSKDIDALKVIELQAAAEEKGYKRATDMHSMAEKKATAIADMRETVGHQPSDKEPSTTKMLLEAVVPAVQSFMASRAGIPGVPAAAPAPNQVALAHTPAKPMNPAIKNQILMRPPVPMRPANAPARPNPAPAQAAAHPVKEPGMSKHEKAEQVVFEEIEKDVMANLVTQKFDPEGTAERVLGLLKPFGIAPDWLCSNYSLDVMMEKARAKGVPDQLKPYIERFHAKITDIARVGLGTPTEGSQPANR